MSIGLAVALLALTSAALAALLLPLLLGRRNASSREDYNLTVYRDQLAEVERDITRGVLTMEQAEAARTEIGRRILAVPSQNPSADSASPTREGGARAATVASVLLLPLAAWTIYWQLGSPLLPDQPFADRGKPQAPVASDTPGHADIDNALARLNAHLKEKPDDLAGWLLLGRTEISLSHYPQAEEAFRRAYELSGQRADIAGDWGEALILAAGGTVTPPAKQAFEAALKDPENAPRARYYLALAQLQQGDAKGALAAWRKLEAEAPADAEYLPLLKRRIAEAEGKAGTAGATTAPNPANVAAAAKATADATPEQRQAMIRGMVESLAAKLADKPDDIDGWTRLGRSYMVLNEPAKARDAYARAVRLKPDALPLKQAYAEAIVATAEPDATAPPADAVTVYRDILAAEPKNQEALWYVGIAEAEAGRADQARELWSRLLAQLPAGAPEHKAVTDRIAALKPGG